MIAYTITGANSIVSIAQIACSYEGKTTEELETDPSCLNPGTGGIWKMTLAFGGAELLLSQVRNLEEAWWVSVLGTLGSLIYGFVALILSIANASNHEGTVGGRDGGSAANKVFNILNSLGAIGFAYNFSLILPEIQDTLKQPPSAIRQMKTTCMIAISGAFFFYFIVAVAGYSALGNNVDEIVLDSFCGPRWALLLSHIAILLHMLTAYQVFGQAMFNTLESHVKWYLLKREEKKLDLLNTSIAEEAEETMETSPGANPMPTPFDTSAHKPDDNKPRQRIKKPQNLLGLDHHHLNPIPERLSSSISAQITEQRMSSVIHHLHSEDTRLTHRSRAHSVFSMYSADTGFANEEVPLNDEGFVVGFQYRVVIRSLYVCLITLLACIMPFFSAFAGLVGAVTYFPLAIYFPFTCYKKVFPVTRRFNILLWVIFSITLVVALVAVVGSVRTIIIGWSTYAVFGEVTTSPPECQD
jgi:hypothetical protein